jgi:hypothetical protein
MMALIFGICNPSSFRRPGLSTIRMQEHSVNAMFDQVIDWGGALKTLREKQTAEAIE